MNEKLDTTKFKISALSSNKFFGFWLYLMSDFVIFITLFSVYIVMKDNIAYGPSGPEIFNFFMIILESFFLLFSSFACSFIFINSEKDYTGKIIFWLSITFILGFLFLAFETYELYDLVKQGHGPSCSGFLSAFFMLLVTHGAHVIIALLWILVMIKQLIKFGITLEVYTRIICLSLFWHFLDIVWIFIFSIVYLFGVVK
ncbi:cytochrome o ubiquinol oxidase subunit III [Buchnera aphidicola (Schlechtendalia chinensis)]|uniref:Cytochrome bo(3) ubiquinol oxidase subunit 3 n=1 Tax=Buchnera aphidicola subsp. Schlechtendalia chinensis TaxID=118110 RepID=A0A172WED2_BUCSC|nr:cytochrome o ubiquinol oxidase subunit III [Buchnera aphidicola (Schlechtendalia chinensis)]